jgi:hypothetical protein
MEMRKYLSSQLRKIYYDSGVKVDKRMFDVLAKAMTNTVIITDPGNSNLIIGDRVPLDMVEKLNKEPQLMDIHDAIGEKLAESIGPYRAGTKITEDIAKDIFKHGYRQVKVERRKIEYKPVFRGLPQQVLLSNDWLNRISRKDIKNTLIEGAIRQWTGDISKYPMPAFAYGVELK